MDIFLINPANKAQAYGCLGESLSAIEPPLWLGLLAGYLREKGFTVRVIDADAESLSSQQTSQLIEENPPLLIGIAAIGANPSASSTPKMFGIRDLVRTFKDKGVSSKICLYGIHPAALPERTLREEGVDFVVRGEAFYPFEQLLRTIKSKSDDFNIKGLWYLKENKIVDNGWADVVDNLDSLPFAAWDMLPMKKYRAHNWHCFDDVDNRSPYAMIFTSLGCPFQCHYCNIHALYSGKSNIRFRSPQKIVQEIDLLHERYNVRHIKILDELFIINEDRVSEICDLLIARDYKINFWAYARIDTVSRKILRKIKKAGINWLAFGIESGSHEVRQDVLKGQFDQQTIRSTIAMVREEGIYVVGNFIFGLPQDTLDSMLQTSRLAQELRCEYANFYVMMAYPGSLLYEESLMQGRVLPRNWAGYSQLSADTLPLSSGHLTPEQILQFRDEAFNSYYQDPGYLSMIQEKFGEKTVAHIHKMLQKKLKRNILLNRHKGACL